MKCRGKSYSTGKWEYINLLDITEELDWEEETVGQDTGRKDRNGKEIYSDDLVICYTKDGEKVYTHPQIVEIPEWYNLIWDETNTEIVGNIHDNPELLK